MRANFNRFSVAKKSDLFLSFVLDDPTGLRKSILPHNPFREGFSVQVSTIAPVSLQDHSFSADFSALFSSVSAASSTLGRIGIPPLIIASLLSKAG